MLEPLTVPVVVSDAFQVLPTASDSPQDAAMLLDFTNFLAWMAVTSNLRRTPFASLERPVIDSDFPDPTIVQDLDGAWYAFATQSAGIHVQAQRASAPEGPWTKIDCVDLLPQSSKYFTGNDTWAPDVRVLGPNSYVLYYSGQVASNPALHCLGVATSTRILGPYAPIEDLFQCDLAASGEIDPSSFRDVDDKLYVT